MGRDPPLPAGRRLFTETVPVPDMDFGCRFFCPAWSFAIGLAQWLRLQGSEANKTLYNGKQRAQFGEHRESIPGK